MCEKKLKFSIWNIFIEDKYYIIILGLGTSSILIGCVLTVLWTLMGLEVSKESLIYSILIVEQMMTTGKRKIVDIDI